MEWVYSKGIDTAWELSNSGVRLAFVVAGGECGGRSGCVRDWRSLCCSLVVERVKEREKG